jgi:hypothetical protein
MARRTRSRKGKKMLTNIFKRSNKVMGKVESGLEGLGQKVTKRAFGIVPSLTKSVKNVLGSVTKTRRHRK